MKNAIAIRFGIAAVLVTAGCLLLLSGLSTGGVLFGVTAVFSMPRSELTRPIPRRELWLTFGVLLAYIVVIVVANIGKYVIPSFASNVMERIICYPAVVVPLWLLMLWELFRNWRRQKAGVDI